MFPCSRLMGEGLERVYNLRSGSDQKPTTGLPSADLRRAWHTQIALHASHVWRKEVKSAGSTVIPLLLADKHSSKPGIGCPFSNASPE